MRAARHRPLWPHRSRVPEGRGGPERLDGEPGLCHSLPALLPRLRRGRDQREGTEARLMGRYGLDPELFDGGSTPLSYVAFGRLIARGVERTGCHHLSLLVGQRTELAALGPIGMLMRNSDTIGDALRALEEHVGKQNWGAVIGLGSCDGTAVLSHSPYKPGIEAAGPHSERALAAMTNVLRALSRSDWAPLEVLLPRSAPRDARPYGDFFRAPIRFDEEMAALVFPDRLLEQPIAGADPAARHDIEEQIHRLEADQPHTLTDELRRYLRTAVTRQRCGAERVARLRMTNRRTLDRHLQAEGTSYKQITNQTQFLVAKQLLADTSMTMGQISAVLHFSEPAGFTHAFRRWSGTAPSAWRRKNLSGKAE